MSFLKEIEEKKSALKKAEVVKKAEFANPILKDEEDYYRLLRETYFEDYYDLIKDFTFKSDIRILSLEEIRTVLQANKEFTETGSSDTVDLTSVENKIDESIAAIREVTGSECKVFVRFSSRSPKDAIYLLEAFPTLIQEKLQELNSTDIYAKLHAFYMASTEILAISSGSEAVDLFRKSSRIVGDLEHCLEVSEPMNLIVREFVQFPVKNELRGFVYQGSLTALTQYNRTCYFPDQLETKAEVEEKVHTFMKGFIVAMRSLLESFVVDIVVDTAGQVWVVEVNPFGELADSCLFSWTKDR